MRKNKEETKLNVAPKTKKRLLERLSLRGYITIILLVFSSVSILLTSYISYDLLKKSKYKDTWAILFLEFENFGLDVSESLRRIMAKNNEGIGASKEYASATHVVRLNLDKSIEVKKGDLKKSDIDKLTSEKLFKNSVNVLSIDGTFYAVDLEILEEGSREYRLFSVQQKDFIKFSFPLQRNSKIYILNRLGDLIYRNSLEMTELNVEKRYLVADFIKNPLAKGQIRYLENGVSKFGFFYQVLGTNLVVFGETDEQIILDEINKGILNFLKYAGYILLAGLILIQFPLFSITSAVDRLLEASKMISRGVFTGFSFGKSFGEFATLSNSFATMAGSLNDRDSQIRSLMIEQLEKQKLEQELSAAQDIQGLLIPDRNDEKIGKLSTSYVYLPAERVAGDFLSISRSTDFGETVIMNGDVSGHGTGSFIFGAMIVAMFKKFTHKLERSFDTQEFFSTIDAVLSSVGKSKYHATMQILVFSKDSNHVRIGNAGHPFPVIVRSGSEKIKRVQMPSSPIGIVDKPKFNEIQIEFSRGDVIFSYSDGIIECSNQAGVQLGAKRFLALIEAGGSKEISVMVRNLTQNVASYCDGRQPDDDICLIGIKHD